MFNKNRANLDIEIVDDVDITCIKDEFPLKLNLNMEVFTSESIEFNR